MSKVRVLFTENIETYRLPKYIDISARKIICATLAKYLKNDLMDKFEIYFAVPRRIYKVFREQAGGYNNIIITDEVSNKYDVSNLKLIKSLLKEASPDVVITANVDDFLTLSLTTILYKYNFNDIIVWQDKYNYTGLLKVNLKIISPVLRKRIKFIVARNNQNYEEIKRIIKMNSILIPIGIDTEIYRPRTYSSRNYDVIFVGRASYEKGFDIFVKTLFKLNKIIESNERIRVKIITNGGPLEQLLYKLYKLNTNLFSISIERNVPWYKMPEYYSESKVLINTSRYEVYGQAMVEALACNCFVLATKTAGSLFIKGYVKDNIKILNTHEPKIIAIYLYKIIKNYDKISKNSRNYVVKYLSGYTMAQKWLLFLNSLYND